MQAETEVRDGSVPPILLEQYHPWLAWSYIDDDSEATHNRYCDDCSRSMFARAQGTSITEDEVFARILHPNRDCPWPDDIDIDFDHHRPDSQNLAAPPEDSSTSGVSTIVQEDYRPEEEDFSPQEEEENDDDDDDDNDEDDDDDDSGDDDSGDDDSGDDDSGDDDSGDDDSGDDDSGDDDDEPRRLAYRPSAQSNWPTLSEDPDNTHPGAWPYYDHEHAAIEPTIEHGHFYGDARPNIPVGYDFNAGLGLNYHAEGRYFVDRHGNRIWQ